MLQRTLFSVSIWGWSYERPLLTGHVYQQHRDQLTKAGTTNVSSQEQPEGSAKSANLSKTSKQYTNALSHASSPSAPFSTEHGQTKLVWCKHLPPESHQNNLSPLAKNDFYGILSELVQPYPRIQASFLLRVWTQLAILPHLIIVAQLAQHS